MLAERLLRFINFDEVRSVHTFLSMTDKNEVDTFSIIDAMKRRNAGIAIAVSKTLPKGELAHYQLNEHTTIEKNNWGIPEPVEGSAAVIHELDVVLVPLISFDLEGHRIGYGKGYYDRFLKTVPRAQKIGLALTPPLDHIPYSHEHDVQLDACVTPFNVYEYNK